MGITYTTAKSTRACKALLKSRYIDIFGGWILSTAGNLRRHIMVRKDKPFDESIQVVNRGSMRQIILPLNNDRIR